MTDEQTLEVKKTVWAYMVENGIVTEDKWDSWNVYGANYTYPPAPGLRNGYHSGRAQKYWDTLLQDSIRLIGIDWDKTQPPRSDTRSQFEGTEADNSRVETLIGDLYFKDGSKLTIGIGHAEQRFGDYVRAVAAFVQDKERVKKIFGEK